jgi:hypothetical protein
MEKLTKGLSGLAGEYFVAGELTRRGYIVTLTLRNTKAFDILVSNESATKAVMRWFNLTAHQTLCKIRVWENMT